MWEKNQDEKNYSEILCRKIIELRKKEGLTQDQLAEKLGITYQAVSKWENSQSCPDIMFLPKLAEIFDVSIDEIFGKENEKSVQVEEQNNEVFTEINDKNKSLPFNDDGKLRAVLYIGHQLIKETHDIEGEFTFKYEGKALNVESSFNISCDDIKGNANAGQAINAKDIFGNATAGNSINCDDIGGNANAGTDINCGDVGSNVNAGLNVNCGDIGNNVSAGNDVNCGNVDGNASVGCNLSCGNIDGNVTVNGDITCSDITCDTLSCEGDITCKSIDGDVSYKGSIKYE